MNETFKYAKATGEDLQRLISAMESVLVGEKEHHVMLACLSLVLAIQYPGINAEQLIEGVQKISEYITLYVSALDEFVEPGKMN